MAHKASNSLSALLLFGGGLLGAGLALMYAPCSGEKSRKKMMRFGKSVSKRSDKYMRNFNDTFSDFADMMSNMGRKSSFLHR